jgi:hypothetical protein
MKRGFYSQTLTFSGLPAATTAAAHARQVELTHATAPPTPADAGQRW